MLVRRLPSEPTQRESESIQHRLSRLRLEQRPGSRPLFTSPAPSTSTSIHPSFQLSPANSVPITNPRKIPGPTPPPSWRTGESGLKKASKKGKERAREEIDRRRLCSLPLDIALEDNEADASWMGYLEKRDVPSLKESCCASIAADLRDLNESIYLDYLLLLPPYIRLEIIEVAAIYFPISEEAIKELLNGEVEEEDEFETTPPPTPPLPATDTSDEDREEWEAQFDNNILDSFPATLTRLNICGSDITLSGLRRLLFTAPHSDATRPTPNFPNLSTLILSFTANLPLRPSLFELFTSYLSLRYLSLSGKQLRADQLSFPIERWLVRLSTTTPNLLSLDLSFIETEKFKESLIAVDWGSSWLQLKSLGVRGTLGKKDGGMWVREGIATREEMTRSLRADMWKQMGDRKRSIEIIA